MVNVASTTAAQAQQKSSLAFFVIADRNLRHWNRFWEVPLMERTPRLTRLEVRFDPLNLHKLQSPWFAWSIRSPSQRFSTVFLHFMVYCVFHNDMQVSYATAISHMGQRTRASGRIVQRCS